jgi:hypothetical protein
MRNPAELPEGGLLANQHVRDCRKLLIQIGVVVVRHC